MAARDERKVVVKKVRAFPIAAQLKIGTAAVKVSIVRLNTRGLLAEVAVSDLVPGEKCEIAFEIPVLHFTVNEPMVVIKQYSQWQSGSKAASTNAASSPHQSAPPASTTNPGVAHLVEAHFSSLSEKGRDHIAAFLKAIGTVDH